MSTLRPFILVWLLLVAAAPPLFAEDASRAGETYFGRKQYIEYLAGNLPVILSAPHGGREKPDELPDREDWTFAFDTNTQELARAVADELHGRTGGWPHLVICRLHRRKLDCNREVAEAAAGNPLAEQAWQEFQGYLDSAEKSVKAEFGRGFYIDLHGHGHPNQRLELGYLHNAEQLAVNDEALNKPQYAAESSLRAIAALNRLSYAELIRGERSFGALMEQHGFPCSPSPTNPRPETPYFRGGYNTARHGRDAAPLAGLQIESYSRGVRDTADNRAKFAKALVSTLETFLSVHAGVELPTGLGARGAANVNKRAPTEKAPARSSAAATAP
jgi:hypothetical protein